MHNYLYRFSIERLRNFKNDEAVMKLFKYYFENHGRERILQSPVMSKYYEAYIEAVELIINPIVVHHQAEQN